MKTGVSKGVRIRRGRRWTVAAKAQIRRQPWCSHCGTTEDLTADHIISLDQGGAAYDHENLTTLCRIHNSEKGARVPVGYQNPGDPPVFSPSPGTPPFPKPNEVSH